MNIAGHDIGVCSWSLNAGNVGELLDALQSLGLGHMQLAMGMLLSLSDADRSAAIAALAKSKITITAGMIGFAGEDYSSIARIRETGGFMPDATWPARRTQAIAAARLCREMGIAGLSTHIGFVPPATDSRFVGLVSRLRELADQISEQKVELLLETGQEPAADLIEFLGAVGRANIAVNFDPANMLLYGAGDPIAAIAKLSGHIHQVHVKDAVPSIEPGVQWGQETAFGQGAVGPSALLKALHAVAYRGPLMIECEGSVSNVANVKSAIVALRRAAG